MAAEDFELPAHVMLPDKFKFWPRGMGTLPIGDIQKMYDDGYAGAFVDKLAEGMFRQRIIQDGGSTDGNAIASSMGLTGAGEGQLVIPFMHVVKAFPSGWPGAAQERGDCVSHDVKNACLTTMGCDIASGKPDEVTGIVEGVPDIPAAGIANGVLSTETFYWWRGYNGDGWSCEAAASVATKTSGLMLRQPYPELGIDLTEYSGSLAGKYGRTKPPAAIATASQSRLIRTATYMQSKENIRDYLANGYGISSCGSEGFSSERDENGVARRRGGWAHAMAIIGYDERPAIVTKYGGPLLLVMNSWGQWNSGPRRIYGTDLDIPEGAFWARWADVKNRTFISFSGANGWPARTLPVVNTILG